MSGVYCIQGAIVDSVREDNNNKSANFSSMYTKPIELQLKEGHVGSPITRTNIKTTEHFSNIFCIDG